MSYREKIKAISVAYSQREKKQFNPSNPFYYIVPMFPYPSGKIHMGHIRNYSISNVVAQYHKYKGVQVFHPIGFDSFGMPAENAAIKNSISPSSWTESNIAQMTEDFKEAGFDFNWENQVQTHKFDYYKFEQEIFRKAWDAGVIYKKDKYVNYDPIDKTVLSNEQVINGVGWRTGAKVVRKKIPMYFFDMKRYAKRLNDDLIYCSSWPKKVVEMQKNWIGYENGNEYVYSFTNSKIAIYESSKIREINAVSIGINHSWVNDFENTTDFKAWIEIATQGGVSEKENFKKRVQFFTGKCVIFKDKVIPCFIDINMDDEAVFTCQQIEQCSDYSNVEIGEFVETKAATFIKLKDWCVSRQRYWGNPIPVIYCDDCGDVISPEDVQLPVDMIPDGSGNVLTRSEDFVNCKCPCCGKPAKRCTDTMDTFVQSSWYFHRYINPNSPEMIEKKDTKINHYIGGVEHATMHLIYARFFQKMMYDFGIVTQIEPIEKLTTQGMVCKKYQKEDGTIVSSKMSKSIGNIVEPKDYIEKYGADAVQMFMIFAGPPDQNFDFEDDGIVGSYRFIEDVYNYFLIEGKASKTVSQQDCINAINKCEAYVDKEFTGRFNLNTTVPQVMIAFKAMKKTIFTDIEVQADMEKRFIKIFGIFAPQTAHYISIMRK